MSEVPGMLPCPHCGSELVSDNFGGETVWYHEENLPPCHNSGLAIHQHDSKPIAAWNHRAPIRPGDRLPGGLVAVPEIATDAMLDAGATVPGAGLYQPLASIYRAMLAAAKEGEG
jgi:hypothetical protein